MALAVGAVVPAIVGRIVAPIDRRARAFIGVAQPEIEPSSDTATLKPPSTRIARFGIVRLIIGFVRMLRRFRRLRHLVLLGVLLLIGSMSAWLPTLVDYAGFGGFPHRVGDEVGPGLVELAKTVAGGRLLDYHRASILTALILPTLLLVRHRALSWLWSAALLYATLLALGPHLVTPDDLFPAVRFLGPLQIVAALAIGAGAVQLATTLWRLSSRSKTPLIARTVIASILVAATIFLIVPGAAYNHARVRISTDYPKVHRNEYDAIFAALLKEPPGRKQSRDGADTHWLNLLPYVYERRDALWQMGGAGLQSSPNYEFLWDERDPIRSAWIFDAPILLFGREHANEMPEGQTIVETQHFIMRRLPSEGLVSPVQVIGVLPPSRFPARAAAKSWLATQAPMKDQVLAYSGYGGVGGAPDGKTIAVHRQLSPGDSPDIVATVQSNAPTTFMIRESWHPRWHAFVDKQQVPVRRVTPDFLAVDTQPGTHLIELRFDRPWWALASWLLIPLMIFAGWMITRRRKQAPL